MDMKGRRVSNNVEYRVPDYIRRTRPGVNAWNRPESYDSTTLQDIRPREAYGAAAQERDRRRYSEEYWNGRNLLDYFLRRITGNVTGAEIGSYD